MSHKFVSSTGITLTNQKTSYIYASNFLIMTRIVSYNVNGIRAAVSKGFIEWLSNDNPDIICIQETKAEQSQLDTSEIEKLGYTIYWHAAQKKGYSGVAVFTKKKPKNIITGIGIEQFDSEGRFLLLEFEKFSIVNSYFPSGTTGDIRQAVKENYLEEVLRFCNNYKSRQNKLIVSGDYNICHKQIDINHPERQEGVSGFLPQEREWVDRFLASGFIDSFRVYNQQSEQYSWWSYRAGARPRNIGWRIDYHMVSSALKPNLKNAAILQSVVHSDHCPVVVELEDIF